VALGNLREPRAVPALVRALQDEDAIVRGHAAWALGRIGGDHARVALRERASVETDPEVMVELTAAVVL
jgi:epoxyqueuosine reductase